MPDKKSTYNDLVSIINRLRAPDGCPWDRVQTVQSLKTSIIEEAYELAEAIDLNDPDKIKEECGDVLLQPVFVAAIAKESGLNFDEYDIVDGICEKLRFRHTHIFGEDKAENEEQALKFWEAAKAKEKNQKTVADKLASVPSTFGALMRANKVQKIASKSGYKVEADAEEKLKTLPNAKDKEKAAGELLFSIVSLLRENGVDPEVALTRATNEFLKGL